MSLSQILQTLKARWRAALLVLLLVVAAGATATVLLPRQYTATASVVLDVKSSDPIAGAVMQPLGIASYMATQSDVIASQRVIVGALRQMKLDQDPEILAKWRKATDGEGDIMTWLAEQTGKKFEVLPSRESNVITVTFTAPTPERAADVVNAIVRSYIATTVELRADPARQYNSFFDGRARQLRQALESAQARLSTFQRGAGVMATDEHLDIENSRLSDLSGQLVRAQADAGALASRNSLGASNADRAPEVLASPIIASLKGDLAQKQARMSELRSMYTESHPDIVTLRANMEEIRQRIAAETSRVLGSLTVANGVDEADVAKLHTALETQRAKVLELKAKRDQAAVLQRDVDNANQAYSAAYTQVSQSNLESHATQTNASILGTAVPPLDPSRPRVLLNMAVAVVLGMLAGTGFAFMREMRDQRLRADDDVEVLLGAHLLGSLPRISAAALAKPRSPRTKPRSPKRGRLRGPAIEPGFSVTPFGTKPAGTP